MSYSKIRVARDGAITTVTLVKVAEALAIGTGRVARLLRDKQVLSGGTVNNLKEAVDQALDEISAEKGIHL